MSKKKSKKSRLRFIILILIILLIIGMIILATTKAHSKEKILKRLISGLENLNYTYEENGSTVQVVGKLEKMASSDIITYSNYDKKTTDEIYLNTSHRESYKNNGITDMEYYKQFITKYFEDNYYDYKYSGKKEVNGQKYFIIDFVDESNQNKSRNKYGVTIWVNDSLNVIEKVEYYILNKNEKEVYDTTDFRFHTGENSLTDVQVPESVFTEYSDNTNG